MSKHNSDNQELKVHAEYEGWVHRSNGHMTRHTFEVNRSGGKIRARVKGGWPSAPDGALGSDDLTAIDALRNLMGHVKKNRG